MKRAVTFLLISSVLLALSCQKDDDSDKTVNCENLRNGILYFDQGAIRTEIEKYTEYMSPEPTATDETGHYANLISIVENINSNCENVTAELSCYCCIETYPPISEILIITEYSGRLMKLILEIYTPSYHELVYQGMRSI